MALSKELYTPWIRACTRGLIDDLEAMAQGEPWPDLQCKTPQTSCLLLAAGNGHQEVCKRLLAHAPHLEARNDDGSTPLSCAVEGAHLGVIDLLLAAGADPTAMDGRGRSPLRDAARRGMSDAFHKLLLHAPGETIDQADHEGITALIASCHALAPSIMQALLEKGADPNQVYDEDDTTVLGYAVDMQGHEHVRLLIKHGARVNHKMQRHTYLHLAVARQDAEMVRILLECGADVSLANDSGITARQAASLQGWKEFDVVLSEHEHARLAATTDETAIKTRIIRL